jgi:hypothetical protein
MDVKGRDPACLSYLLVRELSSFLRSPLANNWNGSDLLQAPPNGSWKAYLLLDCVSGRPLR